MSNKSDLKLLDELEARLDEWGISRANVYRVLGVSHSGYFEYRQGIRPLPRYVVASIEAHLHLSPDELEELIEQRAPGLLMYEEEESIDDLLGDGETDDD